MEVIHEAKVKVTFTTFELGYDRGHGVLISLFLS